MTVTLARAAGLGRLEGDLLRQVGVRAVSQMPVEISSAFAATTETVPISETGLGIVKAVLTGAPALARVDAQAEGLTTSANWLARFECSASLAAPTMNENSVNGVLAISREEEPVQDDEHWTLLCRLATSLGGRHVGIVPT